MFIDILSHPYVAMTISLIVMFSFVIAFLFSCKNWRNYPSVFIVSSILFVNFVLANNALYALLADSSIPDMDFYLRWVKYDAISIITIISLHLIFRVKVSTVAKVTMWLLLCNTAYYFAMHVDIMVNGNREPWLLWSLYTPTVHIIELSIAFGLTWQAARNSFLNKTATQ
jgi:hypothetical protein